MVCTIEEEIQLFSINVSKWTTGHINKFVLQKGFKKVFQRR